MKSIELKDYECVVSKYEIMTDDKKDSLGQKMKLKDLLDCGGDYVFIYDENCDRFGGAYKCATDNGKDEYNFDFENNGTEYDENELLNKMVSVSAYYDYDGSDYPSVDCSFIGE